MSQDLIRESACAVVDKLRSGDVSPLELLDVVEKRVKEVDGKVNALPTLCFDRARDNAKALMRKPAGARGLLAGLPVPIKDLTDVAGVLNTQGSPIFKDNIPAKSDLMVENLEANGAVVYAKSNTPEFGAGANTFNEVFGATLNPWDTTKSAAGSSGGAAVAEWPGWRRAPTWVGPCAARLPSVASSACGRASVAWHIRRRQASIAISACWARWPATSRISRCCSMP